MSKPVLAGKRDRKLNIAEMRNVNLLTADRESLTEIDSVVIDQQMSAGEKLKQLVRQMNPYCYKQGEYVVKISHAGKGLGMGDAIQGCIRNKS